MRNSKGAKRTKTANPTDRLVSSARGASPTLPYFLGKLTGESDAFDLVPLSEGDCVHSIEAARQLRLGVTALLRMLDVGDVRCALDNDGVRVWSRAKLRALQRLRTRFATVGVRKFLGRERKRRP